MAGKERVSVAGGVAGAREQVRDACGHVGGTVGRMRGCRGQPIAQIDRSGDIAGLLGEGAGPMGGMESLVGDGDGDVSGGRGLLGGCAGLSGGTADRFGEADERKGGEGPVTVSRLVCTDSSVFNEDRSDACAKNWIRGVSEQSSSVRNGQTATSCRRVAKDTVKQRCVFLSCVMTISMTTIRPFATSAQQSTTHISGRVVDGSGALVAGVTIATTSDNRQKQVTSGSDGTFALMDLEPGTYTLTASLPGFRPLRRTVLLRARLPEIVDFRMDLLCIPEWITVASDQPLVEPPLPRRSDLVAHLVIEERVEEPAARDPDCRTRYRAMVLTVLKRPGFDASVPSKIELVLNGYPAVELGKEYMIWLVWRPDKNAFDSGPNVEGLVRPVEQGRVNSNMGPCVDVQNAPPNYCPQTYSVQELFEIFEQTFDR